MSGTRSALRMVGTAMGIAVGAYAVYAGGSWLRYGHPSAPCENERDERLDRFMPAYDVAERHHIRVAAPPAITLEAAKEQDLLDVPIVRAIFRAREVVLGAMPAAEQPPRGLMAAVKALGWGVLAEVPGREVVVGAVTRPWEANVTFHALSPGEFLSFARPGYVKIAWTLRADPLGSESVFRTETRAIATDAYARTRFRLYWAFASPGIVLIRYLLLQPVKQNAEARQIHHA